MTNFRTERRDLVELCLHDGCPELSKGGGVGGTALV